MILVVNLVVKFCESAFPDGKNASQITTKITSRKCELA